MSNTLISELKSLEKKHGFKIQFVDRPDLGALPAGGATRSMGRRFLQPLPGTDQILMPVFVLPKGHTIPSATELLKILDADFESTGINAAFRKGGFLRHNLPPRLLLCYSKINGKQAYNKEKKLEIQLHNLDPDLMLHLWHRLRELP